MGAIDYEGMLGVLQWRGHLPDRTSAARTLEAVVDVIREALTAEDAAVVAAGLPPPLDQKLQGLGLPWQPTLFELFEHVAGRTGAPFPEVIERTTAACQVLLGVLGEERSRLLRQRLPGEWRKLFAQLTSTASAPILPESPDARTLAGPPGPKHG